MSVADIRVSLLVTECVDYTGYVWCRWLGVMCRQESVPGVDDRVCLVLMAVYLRLPRAPAKQSPFYLIKCAGFTISFVILSECGGL